MRHTDPWVSGALALTSQCLISELLGSSIMFSRLLSQTEPSLELKGITNLPVKSPEDQANTQATGYIMYFTMKLIHFHVSSLYMC